MKYLRDSQTLRLHPIDVHYYCTHSSKNIGSVTEGPVAHTSPLANSNSNFWRNGPVDFLQSNFPKEEAIFLRFAEGELVCYNKPSDWRADWGSPGPDLCQCSATFCFHEDVCSCRTCSRELDADECFSISESFNLGCPTHNMHMRGEILLLSLEALRHVPILPRGMM